MKKRHVLTAALLATTALIAAPALAAETTTDLSRQMQTLQDQLRSVQQQLDALKAADAAQKDAIAKETADREAFDKVQKDTNLEQGGRNVFENGTTKMIPPANPKVVESGTHSFTLSSADNAYSIGLTGRIHFDMGTYLNQKAEGTTGPATPAGGNLQGGVNARRARLGVTGKVFNDFTFQLILDGGGTNDGVGTAAGSNVTTQILNTALIGYTGINNTILEAGYFAQYFTLDESTSSNNIMFMERATPVTVASSVNTGDPRFGAGFRTWDSNWWFGAYVTGSQPGAIHALFDRGVGSYQRLTYNPIQDASTSVHIGIGAAELFDIPNSGPGTAKTITFSDRPELRIDTTQILSTGGLGSVANPVSGVQIYNVEAAAAFDQFFTQAEYFHYVVGRTGKTHATFDGGYGELSYTFGGRRTYTANCGCYSGVNPSVPFSPLKGGMGAFEPAARISYISLVDQFTAALTSAAQPNAVNGGRQTNYTVGLNWYWNSNMLWKFNYIHSNFDKASFRTSATVAAVPQGVKLDALAARFQIMF